MFYSCKRFAKTYRAVFYPAAGVLLIAAVVTWDVLTLSAYQDLQAQPGATGLLPDWIALIHKAKGAYVLYEAVNWLFIGTGGLLILIGIWPRRYVAQIRCCVALSWGLTQAVPLLSPDIYGRWRYTLSLGTFRMSVGLGREN